MPEVRRVRWRYVKGGLRRVIFLGVGGGLVSCWAACDDIVSVETDAMAGVWKVKLEFVEGIGFDVEGV